MLAQQPPPPPDRMILFIFFGGGDFGLDWEGPLSLRRSLSFPSFLPILQIFLEIAFFSGIFLPTGEGQIVFFFLEEANKHLMFRTSI